MKKILCFFIFVLPNFLFGQTSSDIHQQIQEMLKARDEMLRSLLDDSSFGQFDNHFQDLMKQFEQDQFNYFPQSDAGPIVGEYDWQETETEQILKLKVKQIKDRPLDIKIEKGVIKLKGDVESQEEDGLHKSKRVTKVHFERTFSIPAGVDQTNPVFENKDGELLIKFKKLSPSTAAPKVPMKNKMDRKPPPEERVPVEPNPSDVKI